MYVFIAHGSEWGESDGHPVLATEDFEWLGDLPEELDLSLRGASPEDIQEAVAQALGGKADMYTTAYLGCHIWEVQP